MRSAASTAWQPTIAWKEFAMSYAFLIVLREGFEAFLIVAVTLAYLRKTGQAGLVSAVRWAIGASVVLSGILGYILMQGVNESLWEAVLGLITVFLVATLVIHMWRVGPKFKRAVEDRLQEVSLGKSRRAAWAGTFLFTALMISREGMETALMLLQVRDQSFIAWALLGLAAAGGLAWTWGHFGHRVNLRRFFQVTSAYLLLFMIQVAIYSFHEFAEAGVLANSDALHAATEMLSPSGIYGKWFPLGIIVICCVWLAAGWTVDKLRHAATPSNLARP
jgi:high-affinity iron transporter